MDGRRDGCSLSTLAADLERGWDVELSAMDYAMGGNKTDGLRTTTLEHSL